MHRLFKHYGFWGLAFICIAYLLAIFNPLANKPLQFVLEYAGITFGFWLMFDAIEYKISGNSLVHRMKQNTQEFLLIITIGIIIGIFFEYFGAFVSNLWWEPYYSYLAQKPLWLAILIWFATDIVLGYATLFLSIFSIYKIMNYMFRNFNPDVHIRINLSTIFYWLGWIGIAGIILPLLVVLFFPDLSVIARGALFACPIIGLWLLLEYIEHRQHKRSLLLDIVNLKTGKVLAVVGTSVIIGLAIEGINVFTPVWTYKNFPLGNLNVVGIPLIVLVAWIPFIVLYLSFYRVFFKNNNKIF